MASSKTTFHSRAPKPTVTTLTKSFDLSSMMEHFDEFKTEESITTKVLPIDDLKMRLIIKPKGGSNEVGEDTDHVAIYLHVEDAPPRDDRVIQFCLWIGHDRDDHLCFTRKVHEFRSNWGWPKAFTHKAFKENRTLYSKICIQNDKSFLPPKIKYSSSFVCQHQKLYDVCIEAGDLRLVVVTESEDDLADLEYVPPPKKRKIYYTRSKKNISTMDEEEDVDEANVVRVSSAVLRAASPVFDRLLSTEMVEKRNNQITIHAKSVEDVRDMVYFCCTDLLCDDANPLNLIPLAHMYQMHRLFLKCAERMCRNVTTANYVETVEILNKYDIEHGFPLIVKFGKNPKNREELMKRDDFNKLSCAFRRVILEVIDQD